VEKGSLSQFGPFVIDLEERVVRREGRPVPLTPKAFDVLAALVEQPGRLISKEALLQKVRRTTDSTSKRLPNEDTG
jgi:DNA-binding winged helix-turn-helix (wHTH) protein